MDHSAISEPSLLGVLLRQEMERLAGRVPELDADRRLWTAAVLIVCVFRNLEHTELAQAILEARSQPGSAITAWDLWYATTMAEHIFALIQRR